MECAKIPLKTILLVSYLDSWLSEADSHGQFFSHENIGVVGFGKRSFQFTQLGGCEAGSMPFLFVRIRPRAGRFEVSLLGRGMVTSSVEQMVGWQQIILTSMIDPVDPQVASRGGLEVVIIVMEVFRGHGGRGRGR